MENNILKNEPAPHIYNFKPNNILKCPDCNLLCYFDLNYKEDGKSTIKYICESKEKHEGNLLLNDYLNIYDKNSIFKEKCRDCGKNKNEIQGDLFYCSKCSKFLCNLCQVNHPNGNKHNVINYNKYDSLCKVHGNTFCFFCIDCKKNICFYCQGEHRNHNLINLFDVNFLENDKIRIKKEINESYLSIQKIQILIENLILILNKLKDNVQFIKFYNLLLSTYDYEESQNNLNYFAIQNLKKYEEFLKGNPITSFDSLCNEFNKCITIFQNLKISI